MPSAHWYVQLLLAALFTASCAAAPSATAPGVRQVPAHAVPVPDTVSPEMQAQIREPVPSGSPPIPANASEWKAYIAKHAEPFRKSLPELRERLGVTVEPTVVGGVRAFLVRPNVVPPQNRQRWLIHFHGGGYLRLPGEAGTKEAIGLAGIGGFNVISVDYRMPPDFPYPAAVDDAIAVYRAMLEKTPAKNIGFFGNSTGGALTLIAVLRAKQEHLALPGAIAPGTPMADLTNRGDTLYTLAFVDSPNGYLTDFSRAAQRLYTGDHDLTDPMLSPVYGDMHDFPPTFLTSGTRDFRLSDTVRVHRKLQKAGVETVLQVWEGLAHSQWWLDTRAPEVKEYNEEVARFFDRHLAR